MPDDGSTSAIRCWILALTKTEVRGEFFAFLKKPVLVVEDAKLSLSRLFSVAAKDHRRGRLHLGYTRLQHGARCRE